MMEPGTLMVLLGAVLVYGAGALSRLFVSDEKKQATVNLVCKIGGCVIALIGAVLLFT